MEGVVQSDLRVTITDGKGRELLSFKLGAEERYIISTKDCSITHRKLSRDDHYWSKETITGDQCWWTTASFVILFESIIQQEPHNEPRINR